MVHDGVHWQDFVKVVVKFLFHENRKFWPVATVLLLRRLDPDLSWRRTGFSPKPVRMGFFEGTTLLEKAFLRELQFSPVRSFCHFFILIHLSPTLWFYQVTYSVNNNLWSLESLLIFQRRLRLLAHTACIIDKILKLFQRLFCETVFYTYINFSIEIFAHFVCYSRIHLSGYRKNFFLQVSWQYVIDVDVHT